MRSQYKPAVQVTFYISSKIYFNYDLCNISGQVSHLTSKFCASKKVKIGHQLGKLNHGPPSNVIEICRVMMDSIYLTIHCLREEGLMLLAVP